VSDDRYALITGASSGIGEAYANQLAARGYDLILIARRRDRLATVAERLLKTYGRKVEIVTADLSKEEDLARIENLIRTRSNIEMVVNNAGIGSLGVSLSVDVAATDQLVKLNVFALTRLSLAAVQSFAPRNRGTLINISSVIAFYPAPNGASYSASKAYVLNLTRSLQAEFAKTNLKIQVVMPGPVRSEFFGSEKPPFPDHLFMTAEALAESSLNALDQGELIFIPPLHEAGVWTDYESARTALLDAIRRHAEPEARFLKSARSVKAPA
jgi:uncharacterized protein